MEKDHGGLRTDHVLVDGHHFQVVASQRLQHKRDFIFEHRYVPRHSCPLIRTHKSRPRIQAHAGVDRRPHFFEAKVVASYRDLIYRPALLALREIEPSKPSKRSSDGFVGSDLGEVSIIVGWPGDQLSQRFTPLTLHLRDPWVDSPALGRAPFAPFTNQLPNPPRVLEDAQRGAGLLWGGQARPSTQVNVPC